VDCLVLENLLKDFGGLRAVSNLTLTIQEGERRVIIGPNGAGKTTLFNLVNGQLGPSSGRIYFYGKDITKKSVEYRASLGIARTFQVSRLPLNLSVLDTILLGIQAITLTKLHMWRPLNSYKELSAKAERLLKERNLWEKRDVIIRHLSYGEQREVEVALALTGGPRLLLLDEPTAGLSPAETENFVQMLLDLKNKTCMIIEHDIGVAFRLADTISVLHLGEVIATGSPEEIKSNQMVNEIYLGETS
jgi:branched-chain amino acid transport system ATP-binding protein